MHRAKRRKSARKKVERIVSKRGKKEMKVLAQEQEELPTTHPKGPGVEENKRAKKQHKQILKRIGKAIRVVGSRQSSGLGRGGRVDALCLFSAEKE